MTKVEQSMDRARKLVASRQFGEAVKHLKVVTLLAPGHLEAHRLASAVYWRDLQQPELAVEHFGAVARLAPEDPVALANYAALLVFLRRHGEAIEPLREGLKKWPDQPNLRDNLIAALVKAGHLAEGIALARQALASQPDNAGTRRNLATALQEVGLAGEARTTLAPWRGPIPQVVLEQFATLHNYIEDSPSDECLARHQAYGQSFGNPAPMVARAARRDRTKPLRIAFVSPDLRRHSVASFVEPLLEHLPSAGAEVFVFMTSPVEDDVTARLRSHRTTWKNAAKLEPGALAGVIAGQSPDVVVELSGLTVGNSLAAMAIRPAPLVVTYLGYPNTTGCPFVDVRLVDAKTDPEGGPPTAVERLVRIEECFVCYKPPPDAPEPVATGDGKAFTFGCFGSASKHSPALLSLWKQVLEAVPGSVLLLKSAGVEDAETIALIRERLAAAGVAVDRVVQAPATRTLHDHLATYNRVDLSLDTYPYHGTTTTCESLLMGVPMLTLAGKTHASRVGVSVLGTAGQERLVTPDRESFVAAAKAAAAAGSWGTNARAELRRAFLASPLCDGAGFARRFLRALETAMA